MSKQKEYRSAKCVIAKGAVLCCVLVLLVLYVHFTESSDSYTRTIGLTWRSPPGENTGLPKNTATSIADRTKARVHPLGCRVSPSYPKWVQNDKEHSRGGGNTELKFFVDESFGSKALTHCFFQVLHAKKHCNEMGCTYNVHEIGRESTFDLRVDDVLADIALLEGFKNHHNRVLDIQEANFVVLDLLPTLSNAMPSDLASFGCDDSISGTTHQARMHNAARRITTAPYWQRSSSWKVLMTLSYPVGSKRLLGILGEPLLKVVKAPIITATRSDHTYSTRVAQLCRHSIVVPSLPNPFVYSKVSTPVPPIRQRDLDMFLDETVLKPAAKETVALLSKALRHASLPMHINFALRHTVIDQNVLRAERMRRSKLCILLPNADGQLAKSRLIDSLASGCIPVFFETRPGANPSRGKPAGIPLPFLGEIRWERIGLFLKDVDCVSVNLQEVADLLQEELMNLEELQDMQTYGQEVLAKLRYPETIFQFSLDEVGLEVNTSSYPGLRSTRKPIGWIPEPLYAAEHEGGLVDSILKELNQKPRFDGLVSKELIPQ